MVLHQIIISKHYLDQFWWYLGDYKVNFLRGTYYMPNSRDFAQKSIFSLFNCKFKVFLRYQKQIPTTFHLIRVFLICKSYKIKNLNFWGIPKNYLWYCTVRMEPGLLNDEKMREEVKILN